MVDSPTFAEAPAIPHTATHAVPRGRPGVPRPGLPKAEVK